MSAPTPSVHEEYSRYRKAVRLAHRIYACGIDSTLVEQHETIYADNQQKRDEWWALVSKRCGYDSSSQATRTLTIELLKEFEQVLKQEGKR